MARGNAGEFVEPPQSFVRNAAILIRANRAVNAKADKNVRAPTKVGCVQPEVRQRIKLEKSRCPG